MSEATNKEAYETLSDAERALEEAMDQAATADDQAKIIVLLQGVREEKKQLVAQHLKNNNKIYKALTADFRATKKQLDELHENIKNLVERAEKVAKAAGVLDRLVNLAAKGVV